MRTPLKSKYELYEALMTHEPFLKSGKFHKGILTEALYGTRLLLDEKASMALDWVLDSCVEDGEIEKTKDRVIQYKMKGKGIDYFTRTKEHIKNEEANKLIQRQQVRIQRWMVCLTIFVAIGTFMASIEKFPDAHDWINTQIKNVLQM